MNEEEGRGIWELEKKDKLVSKQKTNNKAINQKW